VTADYLRELLEQDVLEAAPALLGATLVRGERRARIVEVEAYRADDPACHAYKRRTPRVEVMYGPAGIAYVYFNYGVHWMLNIVAHAVDDPAAILIRAAEPIAGIDQFRSSRSVQKLAGLLSGPGKLAQAFDIDGNLNGIDLLDPSSDLHLLPALEPVTRVLKGSRIGIAKGKWEDVPWRFVDDSALEWASRKKV